MKDRSLQEPVFDEMRELYAEIDERQNRPIDSAVKGGVSVVTDSYRQMKKLLRIEQFVERVASGKVLLYGDLLQAKKANHEALKLREPEFALLKSSTAIQLSDRLVYSPYVSAFFNACKEKGVLDQPLTDPFFPLFGMSDGSIRREGYLFDEVVRELKVLLSSAQLKTDVRVRHAAADRDFDSAIEYTNFLFDTYKKLFVIRLDIGYLVPTSPNKKPTFPESDRQRIKDEFVLLIKRLGRKNKYPEFAGHLAKLEFGEDRGYFMHAVLLLDGRQKVNTSNWLAVVDDAWSQKITRGKGVVYDCSQHRVRNPVFPDKGLGLVHRGTAKHRAFERWIVGYVAKSSRYVRVNVPSRERVFFRGIIPRGWRESV